MSRRDGERVTAIPTDSVGREAIREASGICVRLPRAGCRLRPSSTAPESVTERSQLAPENLRAR